MVCNRIFAVVALLQLPGNPFVVAEDPRTVNTCSDQSPCLSVDVSKDYIVGCGLKGACSFTACITLDTRAKGCKSQERGIGHMCDKSGDDCCPHKHGLWDFDKAPKKKLGRTTSNVQCQTGGPGDVLEFIYKDGKRGCHKDRNTYKSMTLDYTMTYMEEGDIAVSCAPVTAEVRNPPALRLFQAVVQQTLVLWDVCRLNQGGALQCMLLRFCATRNHVVPNTNMRVLVSALPFPLNVLPLLQHAGTLQDVPKGNCDSGKGNVGIGKQCLWKVTLPDCPSGRPCLFSKHEFNIVRISGRHQAFAGQSRTL